MGLPLLARLLFAVAAALVLYACSMLSSPATAQEPRSSPRLSNTATAATAAAVDITPEYWLPASLPHGKPPQVVSGCGPAPGPREQQTQRPRLPHTPCQASDAVVCAIAASAPGHSLLLLSSVLGQPASSVLTERLTAAKGAVSPGQLLLVATTREAATVAQSLGVGWYLPREAGSGAAPARVSAGALWRVGAQLLRAGCTVVLSTSRVCALGGDHHPPPRTSPLTRTLHLRFVGRRAPSRISRLTSTWRRR